MSWIVYTCMCLTALSYFLYLRMRDLSNSGVNSSISSVYNQTLMLPKITICNNNGYDNTDTLVLAAIEFKIILRLKIPLK